MKYRLEIANQSHKIELIKDNFGKITDIFIDDQKFLPSQLDLFSDANITRKEEEILVELSKESFNLKLVDLDKYNSNSSDLNETHLDQMKDFFKDGKLLSPLPGKIVDIRYTEGSIAEKGKIVLALEAMKMENEIIAPFDIVIKKIHISVNESVIDKQILIDYELAK